MLKFFLFALASNIAFAMPNAIPNILQRALPATCTATPVTSVYVTTITAEVATITTVVKKPHSCYTFTVATTPICSDFNPTTCGPVPECIIETTTTLKVPCPDACCPTTGTTTSTVCSSCQTGCKTAVVTEYAKYNCPLIPASSTPTA